MIATPVPTPSASPGSGAFAPVLLLAATLLAGILLAGCSGDSPTEPEDGPSLTGTWAGQITGVRWQGAPERDGGLLLVLEESELANGLRVLDGTFAITFADGEVMTGSLRGTVGHEWYLAWHAEPGCVSQMRGGATGRDELTGDWFGWNCNAGGGAFDVRRR